MLKVFFAFTPYQRILFCLFLSPVWWVLGVTVFIYHFFAFWSAISLVRRSDNKNFSLSLVLLGLYIFIYSISIILASVDADFSRIIASLYNLSYWLMGWCILFVIINSRDVIDSEVYFKYSRVVLYFLFGMAILSLVFFGGEGKVEFPSLLGSILPIDRMPPLMSMSMSLNLMTQDWFGGDATPRLSLLAPYPTAFAMTVFLFFCLSLLHRFSYILMFVCVFLVYMSLSRMMMVFFVLLLLGYGFSILRASMRRMLVVIFLLFSLVLSSVVIDLVSDFWLQFNSFRQGSSDLRMLVYQQSIESALKEAPVIGFGIKDRGEFVIPLGSHSTFIGAFYKCGVLGLLLISGFYLTLISRSIISILYCKKEVVSLGIAGVLVTIFSFFEDVDAPQLVSFFIFIIIALLYKRTIVNY